MNPFNQLHIVTCLMSKAESGVRKITYFTSWKYCSDANVAIEHVKQMALKKKAGFEIDDVTCGTAKGFRPMFDMMPIPKDAKPITLMTTGLMWQWRTEDGQEMSPEFFSREEAEEYQRANPLLPTL